MNPLDWLLRTSWQAAVLVLLILAAERLFQNRLSPRWRYALWYLVVLRLILPPISLPGVDLVGDFDRPQRAVVVTERPAEATVEIAPIAPPPPAMAVPEIEVSPVPPPPPVKPIPIVTLPAAEAGVSLTTLLLVVWIAGAVLLLAFTITAEVRACLVFRRISPAPYPGITGLVDRCRREAGIRRSIQVIVTEETRVPALIGLFRPRLLLPATTVAALAPGELRLVVHHELEHVRHHDLFFNWVFLVVTSIHWMNPFVWKAMARLRSERETVRDLGVLARVPGANGRTYGRTILTIVESGLPARPRPARVAILETKNDVMRRVAMLARFDDRPPRGLLLGGLTALALALLTTLAASQSAEDDPARPKAPLAAERPYILVTGFSVTGRLLEEESGIEGSLGAYTEALLADHFQTISAAQLDEACADLGVRATDLAESADVRLAAAEKLGGAVCLTGWACSFGDRVVLIVEVIDPTRGLPGTVHRASCDGVEGIPGGLEELLAAAGLLKAQAGKTAPPVVAPEPVPELPEDDLLDTWPNEAYRKLMKWSDSEKLPATDAERAEFERLLAESMEHARRLHEDPDYRDEWVVRTNVRLHPAFGKVPSEVLRRGPYLIFFEKSGKDSDSTNAARMGDILERFHTGFYDLFGDSLDLLPMDRRTRSHERMLKVFVCTRLATFNQRPVPGVDGYYSPTDQFVYLFLENGTADDPAKQARIETRLVHEATHQLVHSFMKLGAERTRGEEVLWSDPALRPNALWLSEGLAEWMSGAARGDDGIDLSLLSVQRAEEWRQCRKMKLSDWSLPELLVTRTQIEVMQRARVKGLAHGGRLTSLYFAQVASFCHFLWNAEDGAYRDRFLAALKAEITENPTAEKIGQIVFPEGGTPDVDGMSAAWRASLR